MIYVGLNSAYFIFIGLFSGFRSLKLVIFQAIRSQPL